MLMLKLPSAVALLRQQCFKMLRRCYALLQTHYFTMTAEKGEKISSPLWTRAFIMRTTKRKIIVSVQSKGQLSCNACVAIFTVFFHHNPDRRNYSRKCISDYRRANSAAKRKYMWNDEKTARRSRSEAAAIVPALDVAVNVFKTGTQWWVSLQY